MELKWNIFGSVLVFELPEDSNWLHVDYLEVHFNNNESLLTDSIFVKSMEYWIDSLYVHSISKKLLQACRYGAACQLKYIPSSDTVPVPVSRFGEIYKGITWRKMSFDEELNWKAFAVKRSTVIQRCWKISFTTTTDLWTVVKSVFSTPVAPSAAHIASELLHHISNDAARASP